MSEPREIKPFELDSKGGSSSKDFRIKPDEEAPSPKDLSAQKLVVSSDSDQIELEFSEVTVPAGKVTTPNKVIENGQPTSSPEISPGKTTQPVKL